MAPTLCVDEPDLLGIACIDPVAVTQQHRTWCMLLPQGAHHVRSHPRLEEREADLIVLAVHRPEVGDLHFPVRVAAGLDRGLVHGLDAAGANGVELCVVDGLEESYGLLAQLRQPGPADVNAAVRKPPVLTVKRLVVIELIPQEPGEEAHIRPATLDHPLRSRSGDNGLGVATLYH